jgi:hypothetical protein
MTICNYICRYGGMASRLAHDPHEPLDGAAGHVVIILAQRQPDFARAITRVVLVISFLDELHEILVPYHAPRSRPGAGIVIGRRGECAAQLGELGAHRPDSESFPVLADEPDNYRSRRSSSAAKKTEAVFSLIRPAQFPVLRAKLTHLG